MKPEKVLLVNLSSVPKRRMEEPSGRLALNTTRKHRQAAAKLVLINDNVFLSHPLPAR